MFKFRTYPKEGKGVSKGEPEKKPLFKFFDIFFTNIGKFCKLSMIYGLFILPPAFGAFTAVMDGHIWGWILCLPLLLIGPATAGFTLVLRNLSKGAPVFVWLDFKQGFQENFRQGLGVSAISLLGLLILPFPIYYYIMWFNDSQSWWLLLPISVLLTALLIFTFAHYYIYLFMVTMELKFIPLLKNSLILAMSELKSNFVILFFHLLIIVPIVMFFPILYFPVLIFFFFFLGFSLFGFIVNFPAYLALKRRVLDPILAQQSQEPSSDDEEERIFSDQILIKDDSSQK